MAFDRWYRKHIVDAGRKDLAANLRYRKQLRAAAKENASLRANLTKACAEDVLFWMNAFCFVHEPRPRKDRLGRLLPKTIPFITWPHQDPLILTMKDHLGFKDVGVNKSRGEGLSWIGILMALHECLFARDGVSIGLVSSKMEKAHKAGNMDSLLCKLVWEMGKLPAWMVGKQAKNINDSGDWLYNATDNCVVFRKNESQINAFAAIGGTGRGGRYTWFLADELSEWDESGATELMDSSAHATDSRLVIATPMGPTGAYYRFIHNSSSAELLVAHWSQNVSKNRGLYKYVNGRPVACSKHNPLPANYDPPTKEIQDLFARLKLKGFDLKAGERSPWYDQQCDRAEATPQSIAKELDLSFGGSIDKFFHAEFFEHAEKHVRPAQIRGTLYANPENGDWDFERATDGHFHLWTELDLRNAPPRSEYVVSCDVAAGGGGSFSSNSALQVMDLVTKEQVCEFASNTIKPEDFADLSIGVCNWFHGAYLVWEHQGPGTAFGTRIKQRNYGNVFDRKVPWKSTGLKIVREPGWVTTTDTKEALFEGIRSGVKRRDLIIHSRELINEFHQYIRDAAGKIEHVAVQTATGQSAGKNHGDRVIAIGMALQAALDRPQAARRKEDWMPSDEPPPGTLAWREWIADRAAGGADEWDGRTTYELTKRQGSPA